MPHDLTCSSALSLNVFEWLQLLFSKIRTQKIDFSLVSHIEDSHSSMLSNAVEGTATGNGLKLRNRTSFMRTCAVIKGKCFQLLCFCVPTHSKTYSDLSLKCFLYSYFVHSCHVCTFEYDNNFICLFFGKHAKRILNGYSSCSKY